MEVLTLCSRSKVFAFEHSVFRCGCDVTSTAAVAVDRALMMVVKKLKPSCFVPVCSLRCSSTKRTSYRRGERVSGSRVVRSSSKLIILNPLSTHDCTSSLAIRGTRSRKKPSGARYDRCDSRHNCRFVFIEGEKSRSNRTGADPVRVGSNPNIAKRSGLTFRRSLCAPAAEVIELGELFCCSA